MSQPGPRHRGVTRGLFALSSGTGLGLATWWPLWDARCAEGTDGWCATFGTTSQLAGLAIGGLSALAVWSTTAARPPSAAATPRDGLRMVIGLSAGWLFALYTVYFGFTSARGGSCDGGLCGLGFVFSLLVAPVAGLLGMTLGQAVGWAFTRAKTHQSAAAQPSSCVSRSSG